MNAKKIKQKPAKKSKKVLKPKSKKKKKKTPAPDMINNWQNSLHYRLARIAFEDPNFRFDML